MSSLTRKLKSVYAEINANAKLPPFKPGDLVEWRPGLRNKKAEYGEPMIVLSVLDVPIFDGEANSGSLYFREPLDIITGRIDSNGDFFNLYYDSRRLKLYEGD